MSRDTFRAFPLDGALLFFHPATGTNGVDDRYLAGLAPIEMVAIGRSVLARSYDAGDAFPELRALAWKQSGYVVPGGVHVHDGLHMLVAISCRDADDDAAVLATPTGVDRRGPGQPSAHAWPVEAAGQPSRWSM